MPDVSDFKQAGADPVLQYLRIRYPSLSVLDVAL